MTNTLEFYVGREVVRGFGYEFERRGKGWDFTLMVGWFHVVISYTSG